MLYGGAKAGGAKASVATESRVGLGTRLQGLKSGLSEGWQATKSIAKSFGSEAKGQWNRFLTEERGSLILREGKSPKSYPDVALGKGEHLLDFANSPKINAKPYQAWFEGKLALKPVGHANFARPFYRATYRTGKIKFNLENVDIDAAITMDKKLVRSIDPARHPEIKNGKLVTEWELRKFK